MPPATPALPSFLAAPYGASLSAIDGTDRRRPSQRQDPEIPSVDRGSGPEGAVDEAHPARDPAQLRALLEGLFRTHHQVIWRTLRRLGNTPEAAADFTQQAYVIAAERFAQIRPGAEKAFLFSTAIGLAHTSRRREARCQLEGDMEVHAERLRHEEGQVRSRYVRQLMAVMLGRLEPDLVTVFTLFEIEGLSGPEISELLGIPLGTVASRLRRARESFRAEVAALENSASGEPSP